MGPFSTHSLPICHMPWLIMMNDNECRRCKVPLLSHGGRGRQHNNKSHSSLSGAGQRVSETSLHPICLFFCYLIQGLSYLNKWLWLPSLHSTSAVARGKRALEEQYFHCPCFRFVEMTEQGEKAKLFYNLVTGCGCWESESDFDL